MSDILVGPNPCSECGGEYGYCEDYCSRRRPQPPQPEAPATLKLWVCSHCQSPRLYGTSLTCYACSKKLHDTATYIRADLAAERPADERYELNLSNLRRLFSEEDVRRVYACLNALVRMPTEQVESFGVGRLTDLLERPADEDERVRAAREDEREQCALLAASFISDAFSPMATIKAANNTAHAIGRAIRSRSEHVGE